MLESRRRGVDQDLALGSILSSFLLPNSLFFIAILARSDESSMNLLRRSPSHKGPISLRWARNVYPSDTNRGTVQTVSRSGILRSWTSALRSSRKFASSNSHLAIKIAHLSLR